MNRATKMASFVHPLEYLVIPSCYRGTQLHTAPDVDAHVIVVSLLSAVRAAGGHTRPVIPLLVKMMCQVAGWPRPFQPELAEHLPKAPLHQITLTVQNLQRV